MSYLDYVSIYGWCNAEADTVLKSLIDLDYNIKTILDEMYIDRLDRDQRAIARDDIIADVQAKLNYKNIPLKFDIFKGTGLKATRDTYYVYFDEKKEGYCVDGDGEIIQSFSLMDIKKLLELSCKFHKDYPHLPLPALSHIMITNTG